MKKLLLIAVSIMLVMVLSNTSFAYSGGNYNYSGSGSFEGGINDSYQSGAIRYDIQSTARNYGNPNSNFTMNGYLWSTHSSNGSRSSVTVGGYSHVVSSPYCEDSDQDEICNEEDNCVEVSNEDQADSDNDGIGNVCDDCPDDPFNDEDQDGFCAPDDNCPTDSNEDQADADNDGTGDVCDACQDIDQDLVCDDFDNCLYIYNPNQEDSDVDGIGDTCDNCVDYSNSDQADWDDNGVGDVCDPTGCDGYLPPGCILGDPNTDCTPMYPEVGICEPEEPVDLSRCFTLEGTTGATAGGGIFTTGVEVTYEICTDEESGGGYWGYDPSTGGTRFYNQGSIYGYYWASLREFPAFGGINQSPDKNYGDHSPGVIWIGVESDDVTIADTRVFGKPSEWVIGTQFTLTHRKVNPYGNDAVFVDVTVTNITDYMP